MFQKEENQHFEQEIKDCSFRGAKIPNSRAGLDLIGSFEP